MKEVVKTIKIYFENTTNEVLIVSAEAKNQELTLRFLNNFQDYVKYNPHVMDPRETIEIDYKLTYNKDEFEDINKIS